MKLSTLTINNQSKEALEGLNMVNPRQSHAGAMLSESSAMLSEAPEGLNMVNPRLSIPGGVRSGDSNILRSSYAAPEGLNTVNPQHSHADAMLSDSGAMLPDSSVLQSDSGSLLSEAPEGLNMVNPRQSIPGGVRSGDSEILNSPYAAPEGLNISCKTSIYYKL